MYFFFDLLFCVLMLVKAVHVVAEAVVGVHVGSLIANTLLLLLVL